MFQSLLVLNFEQLDLFGLMIEMDLTVAAKVHGLLGEEASGLLSKWESRCGKTMVSTSDDSPMDDEFPFPIYVEHICQHMKHFNIIYLCMICQNSTLTVPQHDLFQAW